MVFAIGLPMGIDRSRSGGGDRVAGGEGGVFGGAVAVDERGARQRLEGVADVLRRKHIAAREQIAEAFEIGEVFVHHRLEESGCEPERGDALVADRAGDGGQRGAALAAEHDASAVQQGHPDFQGGGIERDRRGLVERVVRPEVHEPAAEREAGNSAVADDDALGRAGRSGGVENVGAAPPGPRCRVRQDSARLSGSGLMRIRFEISGRRPASAGVVKSTVAAESSSMYCNRAVG